jgi:hypothetical protein
MQEPIYNEPPRKVGEVLDSLLSTPDELFNEAMQHMLWQHTPRGEFAPDNHVIEYMERLHDVYFFCRENKAKPFACLERIVEHGKDHKETVLALIDSLLYLFSSQWADFPLLAIQLTDFRDQIAPYMEDEDVQSIMKEIEEEKWNFWPRPPLAWKQSVADERQTGNTIDTQLSHPAIAILHHINKWPIHANNANDIARKYGQTSGQKLKTTYDDLTSELVRTGKGKYTVRNYESIKFFILDSYKAQYTKELGDAINNNKK